MATLGEKIKKLRNEKNLTQEELAEQIFVTRTAISKWEQDKGYPSIESLKMISKLFNVSMDQLLSEEELNKIQTSNDSSETLEESSKLKINLKKLFRKRIWIPTTSVLGFFTLVLTIGTPIAEQYRNTLNTEIFNLESTRIERDETADADLEYYKSHYVKKDENGNPLYVTDASGYKHQVYDDEALFNQDQIKAKQVQREGTTILWNNKNAFPLSESQKLSLFSQSSCNIVLSGSGSGWAMNKYTDSQPINDFKQALEQVGYSVNSTLWNFYKSGDGKSYRRSDTFKINEVPWNKYTSEVKNSFSEYGDAAIIVLSRRAGEWYPSNTTPDATNNTGDSKLVGADTVNGDYFDLSQEEIDMIDNVIDAKKKGTFKKVIVLINTANSINFRYLNTKKNDIDSCIWIGQPGTEGINEIANIIKGTSIPSGHLSDTFLMDCQSAPAAQNAIYQKYNNVSGQPWKSDTRNTELFQSTYLIYQENIYVGYKYYETRYEDAVLNQGNASSNVGIRNSKNQWKYNEEVAYPFGFGESYTTFAYENFTCTENKDGDYNGSVDVKNTGTSKGQDAVQFYLQRPYTDYDKTNGIENAAVNLVGFVKTDTINPGQTKRVETIIEGDKFATYDDMNKKTYILEKGNYYVTASSDSHNAINNILAKKGKTPQNTNNVMDEEGNANLVAEFNIQKDDFTKYSKTKTNNSITNRFDDVNWNTYSNKDEVEITYLSRKDWQSTYPKQKYNLSVNAAMLKDLGWDEILEANPEDKMPKYGQKNGLNLADLIGKDFNDPMWDILLDQLTLDEQIYFLSSAYWGTPNISSINKPYEKTGDGPLGLRKKYLNWDHYVMNFPIAPLLSATYNKVLMQEVGTLKGEDMLHCGFTGMYGPGGNIHRSAYGGRNYEYYSEDGYLSGQCLKYESLGISSTGCYVNVKHFALNDQETNRHGVGIWSREQGIREIYLEAFEPAVTEGKCLGLMSSFTRFGTKWSGAHRGLLTDVLRGEWDYKGYVISDCSWRKYMGVADGVMAGNDNILYENPDRTQYYQAKENATLAQAIRLSTKRVLYVAVNSNAMNGLDSNAKIVNVIGWWEYTLWTLDVVFVLLTILSTVMLIISIKKPSWSQYEPILTEKDKKKLKKRRKILAISIPTSLILVVATTLCIVLIPPRENNVTSSGSLPPLTDLTEPVDSKYLTNTLKIEAEHLIPINSKPSYKITNKTADSLKDMNPETYGTTPPSGDNMIDHINNVEAYEIDVFSPAATDKAEIYFSLAGSDIKQKNKVSAAIDSIIVNGIEQNASEIDSSSVCTTLTKWYAADSARGARLNLVAGYNKIRINPNIGCSLNFDYIEIKSDQKLTRYDVLEAENNFAMKEGVDTSANPPISGVSGWGKRTSGSASGGAFAQQGQFLKFNFIYNANTARSGKLYVSCILGKDSSVTGNLNTYFTSLKINGVEQNLVGIVVKGSSWYNGYPIYVSTFNLKEGNNIIDISTGTANFSLDYISII